MTCQHAHATEEQQEKWLLQLGWYFLHEKHHSLLTAKLLHSGSKSVFHIQRKGKNCMCANLCFCLHPAQQPCVCLRMPVGMQSHAFVLGYMNTCSCHSSQICKLPSMMLCMHVTVQTHNHIQLALLRKIFVLNKYHVSGTLNTL